MEAAKVVWYYGTILGSFDRNYMVFRNDEIFGRNFFFPKKKILWRKISKLQEYSNRGSEKFRMNYLIIGETCVEVIMISLVCQGPFQAWNAQTAATDHSARDNESSHRHRPFMHKVDWVYWDTQSWREKAHYSQAGLMAGIILFKLLWGT